MTAAALDERIGAVRQFNRFYTKRIGVLSDGLLRSPFSLTEVRVLYELAHRQKSTAAELARELGLDAGYLSRILRDFAERRLIVRKPSIQDGRQSLLALTSRGTKTFAPLDSRANQEISEMLRGLSSAAQRRLVDAMHTIKTLLDAGAKREEPARVPYLLRSHQPGDMGWVVHRHGVLYAQEHHYDQQFEALVARIVGEFIQNYDVKKERCWIAEREDEIVGSVFLVKKSKSIAKLRLLYVEPSARGLGIGRRLVEECIHFARHAGYRKITLWTQSHLSAARGIYKKAGFRLTHKQPHRSFSRDLVAETWELDL